MYLMSQKWFRRVLCNHVGDRARVALTEIRVRTKRVQANQIPSSDV